MPPVRRRLFIFCSALSLLFCVAVCVLWVRSYRMYFDYVGWSEATWNGRTYTTKNIGVITGQGGIGLVVSHNNYAEPSPRRLERLQSDTPSGFRHASRRHTLTPLSPQTGHYLGRVTCMKDWWSRAGFTYESSDYGGGRHRIMGAPFWLFAVLAAAVPAPLVSRAARQWRRKKRSLCPTCGYDLRASPDRCPECGTEAAAAR